jgi:hypothetical protein
MVEVNWQLLFNSFFSSVRVKIQCKDPTKIPVERLLVFRNKIHLVMFTPEGYVQNGIPSENGSDKGGGGEKKDEDPRIDDDLSDTGHGEDEGDKSNDQNNKDQNNSQGQLSTNEQGSKNTPGGSKNVKRLLQFDLDEMGDQIQTMECANLLGAMELDEEEAVAEEIDLPVESMVQDDEESSQLPEEWVFDLTEQRKEFQVGLSESGLNPLVGDGRGKATPLVHKDTEGGREEPIYNISSDEDSNKETQLKKLQKGKKGGKKQQWGPIMPVRRSSRNMDNGRTMLEKAQETKRKWNLDDNSGNSSKISKPLLISVAKDIGLDIGDGDPKLLDGMVQLDCGRIANSKHICKHPSCCKELPPGKEPILDVPSSSTNVQSNNSAEQNGNSEPAVDESELGWSMVGPKKKGRKNNK